jgi:hypothetical protein
MHDGTPILPGIPLHMSLSYISLNKEETEIMTEISDELKSELDFIFE